MVYIRIVMIMFCVFSFNSVLTVHSEPIAKSEIDTAVAAFTPFTHLKPLLEHFASHINSIQTLDLNPLLNKLQEIENSLSTLINDVSGMEERVAALEQGTPPTTPSTVVIEPINLSVGGENFSLSNVQINDSETVVHTTRVIDTNKEVTSWEWAYKINGGPEISFSSGNSLPVQHAIFSYPTGTKSYMWILRVRNGAKILKEREIAVSTKTPTIQNIPPLTTAFLESCNGQPNPPNQTDFYVSHTLGTTFEQCAHSVRRLKSSAAPTQSITVWFEAGNHEISTRQDLKVEDSGSQAYPITYRSFPGETVVLSGSAKIDGWTPVTDQTILSRVDESARPFLMQVPLGTLEPRFAVPVDIQGQWPQNPLTNSGKSTFTLVYNNALMPLARYPNEGSLMLVSPTTSTGSFSYTGTRPERWAEENDLLINGNFFWDWANAYGAVKSINTATKIIQLKSEAEIPVLNVTPFLYHKYGFKVGQPYYILNALSEIDSPGEWYLDRVSKILYFYPPGPVNNGQTEVPVASEVLGIFDASWITFKDLILENPLSSVALVRGTAIPSVGIIFDGVTMRNSKADGLNIAGNVSQLVVKNGEIYNIGNTGVVMTGGNVNTLERSHNRIENMTIHDTGQTQATSGRAVQMSGVGTTILHNHIYNIPNIAIQVGGNNHRIAYNDIHDVSTDTSDSGAIYMGRSWADQGNVIEYNFFHGIQPKGLGAVMAIYLDDQESGFEIKGNVFDNVYRGVMLGGGRGNKITGNIMINTGTGPGTGGGGAQLYMDGRGVRGYAPQQLSLLNRPYSVPPWSTQYPRLQEYLTDNPGLPIGNTFSGNVFAGLGNSTVIDNAPGHIDMTGNFRSNLDGRYKVLDSTIKFQQIPFDHIVQSNFVQSEGGVTMPIIQGMTFEDAISGTATSFNLLNETGGTITRSAIAALQGSWGALYTATGSPNLFGYKDNSINNLPFINSAFRVNLSGLTIGTLNQRYVLGRSFVTNIGRNMWEIDVYQRSGGRTFNFQAFHSNGTSVTTGELLIAGSGPSWMEVLWTRASGAGVFDGKVEFWAGGGGYVAGGQLLATITGVNNFAFSPASSYTMRQYYGAESGGASVSGTLYLDQITTRNDNTKIFISPPIVSNPATNILTLDAGSDLTNWTASEGATKPTSTSISFPQEASGVPGRCEYPFAMGRFALNTAHRFTGFLTPTTLNYPHTDIKWFVKNDTTGEVQSHQMTFDGHSDQGGQSEIGEAKPFNMVFYSTSVLDQFTVGFENFANNQLGCTFTVSNLGVFIVV